MEKIMTSRSKTLTISIPTALRQFVEYKSDANYGSVSEYIRDLIRNDQRRDLERMDEIYAKRRKAHDDGGRHRSA